MPKYDSDRRNFSSYSFRNLPQPQKTAIIVLSVLGVAIIFLGAWQLKYRFNSPFAIDESQLAKNGPDIETDLHKLDTDKDGLSDYDEINVYGTSRYMPDTDSDGVSDKQEIDNHTDPLCPAGQDCASRQDFGTSTASNTAAVILEGSTNALGTINISSSTSEEDLKKALGGSMDAATLRQLLVESGADKASIDQISDEDLLKSYQEVLNKQNAE